MADQRITELAALSEAGLAATDVLPIADISASETKKITAKDLIEGGIALADASSIDLAKLNQASTTKIGTSALASSGVTAAKLANNSSVAVGTTPPVSDNFDGRGYYNSSTGVLQVYSSGSFSNVSASVGSGVVDTAQLANGAVTTAKINPTGLGAAALAVDSVVTAKIADGAVTTAKIATDAITASQIATGAVGALELADNAVDTDAIVNLAVTTAKLGDGSVTEAKLGNSAITNDKIADTTIAYGKLNLADGSVPGIKIAADSITVDQIGALAVGTSELINGSVTTNKIADDAVTTVKIAADAITASKIATGAVGSTELASDAVTTSAIVNSSVTTAKINDGAVTTDKLGDFAINDSKIANTTISYGKLNLADGSIPGSKLTDASISSAKLASNSVATASIIDANVTTGKLADGAVTASKLGAGAVNETALGSASVTTSKISPGAVTYGSIQNTTTTDVVLGRSSAGGGTVQEIALTAAGRALIDDIDAAAQRTTLGLGDLAVATGTWTNGSSFSGTSSGTNTGDQTITLSGDVTGTGTGSFAASIASSAVTEAKLATNAVTTSKINAGAVTDVKLANNSAVVVAADVPSGSGAFIGQQWVNTNTGFEYTWTGTEWQRLHGIATISFSDTTPLSFGIAYPDSYSAQINVSLENQAANQVFIGPSSGGDAAPTFRAIVPSDLPNATASTKGIIQPGTGLSVTAGTLNHANAISGATVNGITFDGQGHIAAAVPLVNGDIPNLDASKITTGTFSTALLADNAVTGAKLADYSTAQIGEALPAADYIGQLFFNPLDKNIYLWDGNVWQPVGVSIGELIFAGTYDASVNEVLSTTTTGAAAGLVAGDPLPVAASTFNSYYVVVAESGTGIAPAPAVALDPPDIILCDGSAWVEIDVSSTYTAQTASNVGFVPAGTIASTNVQSAIEEAATEAANASNLTSGVVAVARGGTAISGYTKGDLLVASGATTLAKLGVGSNGQVLRANSAADFGVDWVTIASGTVTSVSSSTGALTVANPTTTPALTIRSATTSGDGIVQLSDSISTTSSVLAATPTAVKTAYDLANAALPKAGGVITGPLEIGATGSLVFEGATNDDFETTLTAADATADRTITLPNVTGTLITTGDSGTVTSAMIANSTIVDADISASAAIAFSKLASLTDGNILVGNGSNTATSVAITGDIALSNTGVTSIASGVIVNADINSAAAIAVSKLANGSSRQLLQTNAAGSGVEWANNIDIPGTLDVTGAGTFDSTVTIASGVTLNSQSALRLADADSSHWVAFRAPTAVPSSITWTLPSGDGSASQVLQTNGSGVLSWGTVSADVSLSGNNAFTGANTFYNNTGQTFGTATSTQDGIVVQGRAGGTLSRRISIVPDTLTASRTLTLPDVTGTVVTTGDSGTVTSTMIANGTIVDADINNSAAIAFSKLASLTNGNVLIGNASNVATSVSVTGDVTISNTGVTAIATGVVVNADINASAAIDHSKLANITAGNILLGNASNVPTSTAVTGDVTISSTGVTAIASGVIVDADISASAEIAVSKLADGAARQLLQTDAAGTGVEWTNNVDIPGTLDVTGAAVFDSTVGIVGAVTINDAGADVDVRIEGDTNTHLFFLDASVDRLGINQSAPATKLDLSGSYGQNIVAVSALDIDCSAGNYFTKTISANSTFTVSNVPASRAYSFTLELTHTSGTVTWFSGVEWPGGTAPTLTTGKTHLFMFVTDDGGTRWRGASLVNYTN